MDAGALTDADVASERPATAVPAGLRLAAWWLAGMVVAVVHNGLWATPNLAAMSVVAEHLGSNPFRGTGLPDYVLTGVSLPVVAHLLGQESPHAYARLHLVVLVLGTALVTGLAWRRFGYRVARNLSVLLAVSPAVTVSLQWLGQPDPLTVVLGVLMVVVRRNWVVAAIAVAAGLTHPEQALFMAAVAAAVRGLPDGRDHDEPPRWTDQFRATATASAWTIGGVVLGRAVTEVYFRLADITIAQPRTDFINFGASRFFEFHSQQPLGLLYTLWGPLWIVIAGVVVLRVVRRGSDRSCARRWLTCAVLATLALLPVAVTLDETRVYAVITAPLLVAAAVTLDREHVPGGDRTVAWGAAVLLAVSLAIPGGFTTGVSSWRGAFDEGQFRTFLIDGTHPGDLTGWLLGPFDFTIPSVD